MRLNDSLWVKQPFHAHGFLSGIALSGVGDMRLFRGLHLRLGGQLAYYHRPYRGRNPGRNWIQPGMGAWFPLFFLPTQIIGGFTYRFGLKRNE